MGKETKQILLTIGAMITQQATAAEQQEQQATPERPNIIFILADDMGYGDLSCYGNRYIKTPNIDRLAATGTSFTQAYAGSGISSPSRCSLMTGRNSGNTRIRDNQCYAGGLTGLKINPKGDTTIVRRANLLPQDTTIAKVIGTAGYRTCLVNKWHLDGYDPALRPTIAASTSSMAGPSPPSTATRLITILTTVFGTTASSISRRMPTMPMCATIRRSLPTMPSPSSIATGTIPSSSSSATMRPTSLITSTIPHGTTSTASGR